MSPFLLKSMKRQLNLTFPGLLDPLHVNATLTVKTKPGEGTTAAMGSAHGNQLASRILKRCATNMQHHWGILRFVPIDWINI